MGQYDMTIEGGIELLDGFRIPKIGFGTYKLGDAGQVKSAVLAALEAGYRHIDCARIYGNERAVGSALRECGIPRDELFVTSKVWNDRQIDGTVRESVLETLDDLGLDHLDLLLVHWPVEKRFVHTWETFQRLRQEGLTRSIGVSNHQVKHLEAIISGGNAAPVVNQMEHHPYMQDSETRAWCRNRKIVYEAWAPLGRGIDLEDSTIVDIARMHGTTPAQVVIAWMVARKVVPIPRSADSDHIYLNTQAPADALTEGECIRIDALNKGQYISKESTPRHFNKYLNKKSSHF